MATVTAPWWLWWVLGGLAAAGVVAVCWVAAGWAERLADWLRRDRVTPLLEDMEGTGVLCAGCAGFEHCDGLEGACDCTCGWSEDWADEPLPPERTWEQMTSHQLPTGRLCAACGSPDCPGLAAVDYCPRWQEAEARHARGEFLTTHPLGAMRERRAPWWETEQRQAYAALDLEYPSGLMARVREAAQ